MRKRITFIVLMVGLLFSLTFIQKTSPSVGVGVNPAELFFSIDDCLHDQAQALYVINIGDEEANYEVSLDSAFPSLIRIEPRSFKLSPGEYVEVKLSVLPWRFPSAEDVNLRVSVKAMPLKAPPGSRTGPGIKLPVYVNFKVSSTPIANALAYLRSVQADDGGIEGFATSAWAVMAIAAAGMDPHQWNKRNGPSIIDYLRANAEKLDPNNPIDWAMQTLAAKAAGEDPKNFGGTDCIKILEGFYNNGQLGDASLLNDDFWGLMALASAG
ncbi:MAG: hypothetical protein ACP5QI_00515, partial [Candidatus Bathyarchaeia archaeon]